MIFSENMIFCCVFAENLIIFSVNEVLMKNFIGRTVEIEKLENLLKSPNSELLAVYGRRRVGKTYLISEFFKDKGIYFELTGAFNGKRSDQLRRFPSAFHEAFPSKERIKTPKDWTEVFELLWEKVDAQPASRKVILFFDELPWLAAKKSDLLMALEHSWNRYFSRKNNVIMILCGSAASWMIKKIVNNTGGLYGRLTDRIHLKPFTLLESEQFLQAKGINLERKQLAEVYMAIGGIPKYLDHIKKGNSASQIIQDLCFSYGGFLTTEFQSLIKALFGSHGNYIAVIEALAKRRKGLTLNEIVEAVNISSGGQLTSIIDDLKASGFIGKTPYFGKKKKDARYKITDEYTLFYLTWIEDALFQNETPVTKNYWQSLCQSQKFNVWAGYAFENVCFKHIDKIVDALKLSVVARSVSYFEHRRTEDLPGAQIDLVIDRADKSLSLCEIKFYNGQYLVTNEYAEKLRQKRNVFQLATKTRKALFNVLITLYGAVENQAYHSAVDQQVDLSSFFTP